MSEMRPCEMPGMGWASPLLRTLHVGDRVNMRIEWRDTQNCDVILTADKREHSDGFVHCVRELVAAFDLYGLSSTGDPDLKKKIENCRKYLNCFPESDENKEQV